jgi:Proliferating cell nuclear antigen, C-terminal domain
MSALCATRVSSAAQVRMPSPEFQRVIRDLASIGDTCTISVAKGEPRAAHRLPHPLLRRTRATPRAAHGLVSFQLGA